MSNYYSKISPCYWRSWRKNVIRIYDAFVPAFIISSFSREPSRFAPCLNPSKWSSPPSPQRVHPTNQSSTILRALSFLSAAASRWRSTKLRYKLTYTSLFILSPHYRLLLPLARLWLLSEPLLKSPVMRGRGEREEGDPKLAPREWPPALKWAKNQTRTKCLLPALHSCSLSRQSNRSSLQRRNLVCVCVELSSSSRGARNKLKMMRLAGN